MGCNTSQEQKTAHGEDMDGDAAAVDENHGVAGDATNSTIGTASADIKSKADRSAGATSTKSAKLTNGHDEKEGKIWKYKHHALRKIQLHDFFFFIYNNFFDLDLIIAIQKAWERNCNERI